MMGHVAGIARLTLPLIVLWSFEAAEAQQTFLQGKIQAVSLQGVMLELSDSARGKQSVVVAAGRQTKVRINMLAGVERIRPGAYVHMRVLWDGENLLRARSIQFPAVTPRRLFGLYKG